MKNPVNSQSLSLYVAVLYRENSTSYLPAVKFLVHLYHAACYFFFFFLDRAMNR